MTPTLDLSPFLIVPGNRVITRRTMSERAKRSVRRHDLSRDPLMKGRV